jgi:hypothetical protein
VRRKLFALVIGCGLIAFLVTPVYATQPDPGHTITLCHATGSRQNPYDQITVDVASVDLHGHAGHADDIIPAFNIDGVSYPGQNLDLLYILANGCNVPPPSANTPTVTKNANGTYDTTYQWGITKSVNTSTQNIFTGGSASFNYVASVTHDGGTPTNVHVNGNITVTNTNPAALSITGVTDQLSNNTTCAVSGGGASVVPASGTEVVAYTCDLGDTLPTSVSNTATITWADQTLSDGSVLAAGNASGTVPVTFTQQNNIDSSVTVTDTLGGTLGTASVPGPSPVSFAYTSTFTGDPTGTCTQHPNTATLTTNTTGTTHAAGQTISVCVTTPPPPSANTPTPPSSPLVDHFLCYSSVSPPTPGRKGFTIPAYVGLSDQFNTPKGIVPKIGAVDVHCNSVQKTIGRENTFVTNPDAHLLCWRMTVPNKPRSYTVNVTNQFGSALLKTGAPTQMCLPTWSSQSGPPDPPTTQPWGLSNFTCYDASYAPHSTLFRSPGPVQLQDEFSPKLEPVKLGKPFRLCLPSNEFLRGVTYGKANSAIQLLCFSVSPTARKSPVYDQNLFGTAKVKIVKTNSLCLPSTQTVVSRP